MGSGGVADGDGVARSNRAAGDHYPHDARSADLFSWSAVSLALDEHHFEDAVTDVANLGTRIAQTGERNESGVSDSQHRSHGQSDHVDSMGRYVLPELSGDDGVTGSYYFVEQLLHDEMDLSKIGLRGVGGHPGAMLDGGSEMGVPVYPQPSHECDRIGVVLGERVVGAAVDGYDGAVLVGVYDGHL